MTNELGHAMCTNMFSLYMSPDDVWLKKRKPGKKFLLSFLQY